MWHKQQRSNKSPAHGFLEPAAFPHSKQNPDSLVRMCSGVRVIGPAAPSGVEQHGGVSVSQRQLLNHSSALLIIKRLPEFPTLSFSLFFVVSFFPTSNHFRPLHIRTRTALWIWTKPRMQHAWEFIIILHVNVIVSEGRNALDRLKSDRFPDSCTIYFHALFYLMLGHGLWWLSVFCRRWMNIHE